MIAPHVQEFAIDLIMATQPGTPHAHEIANKYIRYGSSPRGAQALIELLERIGVDFRLSEVRGALEDILRLGSANIPDLWLSDEEMIEKGLVES